MKSERNRVKCRSTRKPYKHNLSQFPQRDKDISAKEQMQLNKKVSDALIKKAIKTVKCKVRDIS